MSSHFSAIIKDQSVLKVPRVETSNIAQLISSQATIEEKPGTLRLRKVKSNSMLFNGLYKIAKEKCQRTLPRYSSFGGGVSPLCKSTSAWRVEGDIGQPGTQNSQAA
jgi:hypothetical protein